MRGGGEGPKDKTQYLERQRRVRQEMDRVSRGAVSVSGFLPQGTYRHASRYPVVLPLEVSFFGPPSQVSFRAVWAPLSQMTCTRGANLLSTQNMMFEAKYFFGGGSLKTSLISLFNSGSVSI